MTDTETSGQQIDAGVQTPVTETNVSVPIPQTETPAPAEVVLEKMVPQSKVNEIVGAAKRDATEKAYEKAKSELQTPRPIEQPVAPPQQPSGTVQPQLTEEYVKTIINEQATQKAHEAEVAIYQAQATEMINDFSVKAAEGRTRYDDFETIVAPLRVDENVYLVQWARDVDNISDVLYELGKNGAKFNVISGLMKNGNIDLAKREFLNLSKSIKANDAGMQQNVAPTPLGQIEPSNTGTDNGAHTVRDLQKLKSLRG